MVYLDTVTTSHYWTMATFSSKSFTDAPYISCWPLLVFCSAPFSSQAILPTPLRLPSSSKTKKCWFLMQVCLAVNSWTQSLAHTGSVKHYLSRWSKLTSATKRYIEHVLLTLWEDNNQSGSVFTKTHYPGLIIRGKTNKKVEKSQSRGVLPVSVTPLKPYAHSKQGILNFQPIGV